MAATFKISASARAAARAEPFRAPARRIRDAAETHVSVPAAVLAHRTSDRIRIRIEGRQAEAYLHLAASEMAWHRDVFRIRINPASSSLIIWVRLGSELAEDGAHVVALVSETLRRIAAGERNCAAPIETSGDPLGAGLSRLLAVAL